jgi:hypothetical protein
MEWKIDYLEEDGIVVSTVSGLMDWEQHKRFAEEIYPLAQKHGSHKILIDFRDVTTSFTILQIDDLPAMLKELGVGPEFKIAALHDPSSPKSSEFKFFRDSATLLSISVRHFTDADEAIAWLKS